MKSKEVQEYLNRNQIHGKERNRIRFICEKLENKLRDKAIHSFCLVKCGDRRCSGNSSYVCYDLHIFIKCYDKQL